MSHTAVDSDVLFWFMVALTVLLGMLIGVVVRTPPEPSAHRNRQGPALPRRPSRGPSGGRRPPGSRTPRCGPRALATGPGMPGA